MVKILHGADFHLDTRFESLPPEKAKDQRREQRRMLHEMATLVKTEKVQLVLLSGDLLDSGLSYYETHEALRDALEEMSVPVYIAPGNHDWYSPRCTYATLKFPGNVHIFTRPEPEYADIPELGVRVWGAAFTSPVMPSMLDGFKAAESELVNIMTVHGELGGETYAPIDERVIGETGLDYLALGHVHTFSGIMRAGNTYYAYPGCPMGRGFDETGRKGVIIGSVDKGTCDLRFTPLSAREYRIIKATEKKLDSVIPDDGRDVICRLILTGEWSGKPDVSAVTARYSDCFFHLSVKDETRPIADIWSGMGEDNLRGLFLRMMREKYDAAEVDRDGILLATEYGLAAIDNREEVEM